MNDIRFGGSRPTHLIETGEDATDQQVDQVVRQILDGNEPPFVLPKGWSIHPIEYPPQPTMKITYADPALPGLVLAAFSGFIVGVAVMALLLLGGII